MFVVEANGVHQLVDDSAHVNTPVGIQRQPLHPANGTHVGPAAERKSVIYIEESSSLFTHHIFALVMFVIFLFITNIVVSTLMQCIILSSIYDLCYNNSYPSLTHYHW